MKGRNNERPVLQHECLCDPGEARRSFPHTSGFVQSNTNTVATDFRNARMDRGSLLFCQIRLTAQKPTKLPTVLNTIGDHIRKRRMELEMSQSQLAERLG